MRPSLSLFRDLASASKRLWVAGMLFGEGNSRGSAAVESEAESSRNGFLGEETMLAEEWSVEESKDLGDGGLEIDDDV